MSSLLLERLHNYSTKLHVYLPDFTGHTKPNWDKYKGKPKAGFELWISRIQYALTTELIPKLTSIDAKITQNLTPESVIITNVPDFGSLASCAQECGKAVFEITQEDTALINNDTKWTGATWTDAQERMKAFEEEFQKIYARLELLQ